MRGSAFFFAMSVLMFGCHSNTTSSHSVSSSTQSQKDYSELQARAVVLAREIRDAMSVPSILKIPVGPTADTGRGRLQSQVAQPQMRELVECGKAAEEPYWQLINDSDASIRHSSVILLNWRNPWKMKGENLTESRSLIEFNIPLLERALTSSDSVVRFWACEALADYKDFSGDCLERLKTTLPKIRELQKNSDEEVRSMAYTACELVAEKLSRSAINADDRKAAAEEWERLQKEKKW